MTILEKIIARKKIEVEERRSLYPVKLLEKSVFFESPCVSFRKYMLRPDKAGIIAEIKRKSPSLGMINKYVSIERTSIGYMQAGASALSILTDTDFFGGKNEDLSTARKFNYCPILRKDFVIDAYQVIESKSIGADVVLLLANVLDSQQIKDLSKLAHSLGMEVLLEVRTQEEIGSANEFVSAIGVNNRDLNDFSVNTKRSFDLADRIPPEFIKVSESGLSSVQTVHDLRMAGFNGFLMGEAFMKDSRPEQACERFIRELKEYKPSNLKTEQI
jgi:indole-3-glycerol phosphate synthase